MKRLSFAVSFLALSFLILLPSVNAAPACGLPDDDQLILKLSALTNAHAEVYNGASGYSVEICYNQIFGALYTGANPHTCASNTVVRLSGSTNAHLEGPAGSAAGYVPVCYGDLSCSIRSNNCLVGEKEVIALSSATNAHAETNNSNNYNSLVCCTVGFSPGQWSVRWEDRFGNIIGIPYGKSASVNQTVKMIANTPFAAGVNITFELRDNDCLTGNPPCGGDDIIRNVSAFTNSLGVATISNYLISDQDMAIALADEPGFADKAELYFIASSGGERNVSVTLDVNSSASANNPPNASISGPKHRAIYYKDRSINFTTDSIDFEGGALTYLWRIAEDNFQITNKSFTYIPTVEGQKTITLRVTDNQGAVDEEQIAILVVGSPGILAFVNQPRHQQILVNRSLYVRMNANDSYVINSAGSGCPTVSCLAGVCPSVTQNVPLGCAQASINVGGTPKTFANIFFDWSFNDGDVGVNVDGLDRAIVTKSFGLPSAQTNDKQATLKINYTDGTVGTLTKTTNRVFTLLDSRQCMDNGHKWVEYDEDSGEVVAEYDTLNGPYCRGRNGLYGDSDDCCPVGMACSPAGCVATNVSICQDYSNRTACNNDPYNVGSSTNNPGWNDPPKCGTTVNGTVVKCSCAWNGTSETSGVCGLSKKSGSSGGNGDDPGSCIPSSCYYPATSPAGECINGYATINVDAIFTPGTCAGGITPAECVSGPRTILCGRPSVALDFFGIWQFMSSLVFIAVVYYLMASRRKR